jgi:hypothetical protein
MDVNGTAAGALASFRFAFQHRYRPAFGGKATAATRPTGPASTTNTS